MNDQRRTGLLLALVAALISGVAVYLNGEAVRRFPSPTVYTTGKNLLAGIVLVAIAIGVRSSGGAQRSAPVPLTARHRWGLVAVAVIGGAIPFVLFFEGLSRATSSDAAFLHKTLVVWVAILAVTVLGERVTGLHIAAVAALMVGQVAIAEGVGSLRPGLGEAMILTATICWAIELIVVKQLVVDVAPSTVGAARIGGGSLLLIAWLALTGRMGDLAGLSGSQWAWLVLTGTVLSAFVSVWFAAVARAQVVDVAAVLVPGAVITGLLGLAAGGTVAPIQAVGWLLMVIAVAALVGRQIAQSTSRRPARVMV